MSATLLSIASTLIFIGFIFLNQSSVESNGHILAIIVIIVGLVIMIYCLFQIRKDERDEKKERNNNKLETKDAFNILVTEIQGLRKDFSGSINNLTNEIRTERNERNISETNNPK